MPSRFSDLPMALSCPSEPGRVGAIDQMALSMEKSTITYKCLCCLAPVYHQTSFTVGEPLAHLSCRKETKNSLSNVCTTSIVSRLPPSPPYQTVKISCILNENSGIFDKNLAQIMVYIVTINGPKRTFSQVLEDDTV